MPRLEISLLGAPKIAQDGVPLAIPSARSIPLIAYLAITGKSQTRETLANLLWTESNPKKAMAALRTTLWRLKTAWTEEWVVIDRNEVALTQQKNIEVDVLNFMSLLDKCNAHSHPASQVCLHCTPTLTDAIDLYHGEFMAGFNISKAPTFDDWRMQQSETLQTLYLNALERLVKCHRTFGDFNLAIHYARLWLRHDRLNEKVNYQLLQLYSITGQRTAAISLYKQFRDILSHGLEIEPSEEITSLYRQILSGRLISTRKQTVKTPVLLIADIEKAALYWAQVGNKKNDILSTYINTVKETAKRFGGFILQRGDNNVTLLFENGQPLHCAVTLHLKIKKIDWGEFGPPNIRMVLYSTILEGENPENFAVLTRTASSLLSISWGGQIVFTDQTLRLLDIPPGSNIKDLGFHYLNEADGAVHVFELLHPHLPALEHPPLLSSKQQLVNFPSFDPPFIGREEEIHELSQLLISKDHRIISLVGPGGVGKTRLAVQVASRMTEYFPDGIFFISFTSIEDPEFIPILLADVLKFSFYGPTDYIDQLRRYLHRMKALLMIDNFEQLRAEGSKLLAFLLTQTHYLKILVTSRERLNMIAETIYEVHGLPIPASTTVENADNFSSIQLFRQNAQRTSPRFSYRSNSEAIIRICELVDGLPLGILLASSWVRVFSCPEIASEIKKNIDFLTTSAPDVDQRHRSLRAVFDHSWKLMSEEERRVLCRLSIFQAPFSTHAASEICDATPLLLSVFMDKSLLSQHQDDRFEMLTTFRQYVFSRLEIDEAELSTVKIRFCEYYAEFCAQKQPELNTSNQLVALTAMVSEIENIWTAWSWMVESDRWDLIDKVKESLLTYHIILGNYVEGGEFFRLPLLKLSKLDDPKLDLIRAFMQQYSAWMTFRKGYLTEAIQGLLECLQTFRNNNSQWGIAMTLQFLAEVCRSKGELEKGKEYIQEALNLLQQDCIPKSNYVVAIIAYCQSIFGTLLTQEGAYEQARLNFQTSLATHNRLGTNYGTIHPLMGLGMLAFLQGDFLQARDLYLQALKTASYFSDQRNQILIHNHLGAVNEVIANTAESYRHVLSAYKLCQETGDHRLTAVTLNNLAYQQLRYKRQPGEAIWTYHKCLEIFNSIGDLRGIANSSYDISKAYLAISLIDDAWNYCLRSLHTSMTLDNIPLVLHSLHGFANLFAHTSQYERALQLCYLIIYHPAVEPDTKKRAVVSRLELEATLSPEIIQSACQWGKSANLQGVIDQILAEKNH